jgi:hypothetical protein
MIEIGYSLSSEEWGPRSLVELAERAEELGFSFAHKRLIVAQVVKGPKTPA